MATGPLLLKVQGQEQELFHVLKVFIYQLVMSFLRGAQVLLEVRPVEWLLLGQQFRCCCWRNSGCAGGGSMRREATEFYGFFTRLCAAL
ncbi:hypothetical protein CYD26_02905 [Pseudomonas sp. FFUP_PS_473]|jgi:hypothetical protein|uniref:hypothetical protein n=1 Tax=unclassified Pseudomonas TaxID=196821 RepID=UPI000C17B7C6|nr:MULTISPECIES: hypothetical protein [unclassified Pseudomonas]ATR84007.1 hypothetical protein CS390_16420 [Pseudomonas sp. HLS-6]PLP95569.1 hypothetical protein CYD26_02905 [Pseudomonas sp. FFUP_PS_473]